MGGMSCYRERRTGCRKRKSVRGCIVGPDLAVMNLVLAKKGAEEIPGLTDDSKPRRLGPKRAANIRKLFNLEKKDDVKQFVVRRQVKEDKKKKKAPKIHVSSHLHCFSASAHSAVRPARRWCLRRSSR